MPRVSVLMIFHRVTPFLPLAVRSVLDQTLRDLELVLVDNGTGASLEVLADAGRDPRIRLHRHPTNLGIAAGQNTAFANACGEYIALLDSDDIALPRRLERQLSVLEADSHLGLVSSAAEKIDEAGRVTGREFALLGEREQFEFLAYTNPAPAPSYTGRREVFAQFPWRPEFTAATDYDFLARAAEVWRTRGLPEVLTRYRYHGGQTTQIRNADQIARAGLARLMTARRRSHRPEKLPEFLENLAPWLEPAPRPAEAFRFFAEQSLQERFPLLAVYHARKLLSVEKTPGRIAWALRVLAAAWRQEPKRRLQLARMFLTGPLRTHGLKPA